MLRSMKKLAEESKNRGIPFWEVILEIDMKQREVTRAQSIAKMRGQDCIRCCMA